MRYADPLAQQEIDKLRAGEDVTPPGDEPMTAGQLWHALLEAGSFHRLRILDKFIDAVEDANRCFLEHGDVDTQP